ncbi:MAG: 30S ribosomal protein S12 methylthiotransferase RimO [Chlamydiae bacterium]|nr:30S ribosomal protein S12 methylthiotransferase RimO [Chlamydiota bacterium]
MFDYIRKENKIHFTSLGCARNLVDTEVMMGMVLQAGYEISPDLEEADFLVINTCGFLEESRKESSAAISEVLEKKQSHAKVVVVGCMVQKYGQEIRSLFPKVHYFLGSGDMEEILKVIQSNEPKAHISDAKSYLQVGEVPRFISTPKHYAYLKIAEGCAKRCSFCIIPSIKGKLKSKEEFQVIKEFHALLDQGVFEIIFIAQDLGDYGKERKEQEGLEKLIREILKIDRPFWLRLLYLYPDEITPSLIQLIKSDRRICPYLDMPIQHINDEVLRKMRRKTNGEAIIQTIQTLRKEIPEIVIRTSLMVGFPGETDGQFEELYDFVKKIKLDNVGIFKFSLEKEAHASTLPNQIAEQVKQERFNHLMNLQLEVARKNWKKYRGRQLEVLVEGIHPDSPYLMRGRFYGQCPDIDGQVIINDGRLVSDFGKIYQVEITDSMDYDLIGRVVKSLVEQKNRLALV